MILKNVDFFFHLKQLPSNIQSIRIEYDLVCDKIKYTNTINAQWLSINSNKFETKKHCGFQTFLSNKLKSYDCITWKIGLKIVEILYVQDEIVTEIQTLLAENSIMYYLAGGATGSGQKSGNSGTNNKTKSRDNEERKDTCDKGSNSGGTGSGCNGGGGRDRDNDDNRKRDDANNNNKDKEQEDEDEEEKNEEQDDEQESKQKEKKCFESFCQRI
eukprot:470871_1